MATSNTRLTFGTLLGTVNDVAEAATAATHVITDSIGMLGDYVSHQRKSSQFRQNMDSKMMEESIRSEKIQELYGIRMNMQKLADTGDSMLFQECVDFFK